MLNTSCPSARVETTTWSLFCGTADTNVIGSPSGSWKLPSAFVVYVAPWLHVVFGRRVGLLGSVIGGRAGQRDRHLGR